MENSRFFQQGAKLFALLWIFSLLAYALWFSINTVYVDGDFSVLYEAPAEHARGKALTLSMESFAYGEAPPKMVSHMPLHYWLTGEWFKIRGAGIEQAIEVTYFETLLALGVIVLIAARMGGVGASLISLGVISFGLATLSGNVSTVRPDMATALFQILALFATIRAVQAQKYQQYWWFLGGLFASAATLTHGNSAFVLIFGLGVLVILRLRPEGGWHFRALSFSILGVMVPVLLFALWWGADLVYFLEKIYEVYYRPKDGYVVHKGAQFVSTIDQDLWNYLLQSIKVEWNFRLTQLAIQNGWAFVLGPLAAGTVFVIWAFMRWRQANVADIVLALYLLFALLFLVFGRPNHSVSYIWQAYFPLALVSGIVLARVLQRLAHHSGMIKVSLWGLAAGAMVLVSQNTLAISQNRNQASLAYAPYDEYGAFFEKLLANENKIIGETRLSIAFSSANQGYTDAKYAFEFYKNVDRPLNEILQYDFVLLNHDMAKRLKTPESRAFLDQHYDVFGVVEAYPYGRTEILRRKAHEPQGFKPFRAVYNGGIWTLTPLELAVSTVLSSEDFTAIGPDAFLKPIGNGRVLVTTSSQKFGYAAKSPQLAFSKKESTMHFRADVSVHSGGGALGVLDESGSRWLANTSFRESGVIEGNFSPEGPFRFVWQNNNAKGVSKFEISPVSLLTTGNDVKIFRDELINADSLDKWLKALNPGQ